MTQKKTLTCSRHDMAENFSFGIKQQSLTQSTPQL